MGRPKPLVRLGERTFLDHVLAAVRGSSVSDVVVVVGDHADEIRRAVHGPRVKVVENRDYAQGLSSSLKAGLRSLPSGTSHVLIVLADQPFVEASTLDALIARAGSGDGRIFIPTYRGVRGNPVAFDVALAPDVQRIEGDVGCRAMFPDHPGDIREVPVDDPGTLVDVDTPAELASFEEARRSGEPLRDTLLRLSAPRLALHASPEERPAPKHVWRRVDISTLVDELRFGREPFALATVVRAVRPTSGRPGYKAVVRPDGSYVGWVGGSCTEHLLVTEAKAALRDGVPRLLRVSPGGDVAPPQEGIVDHAMECESGGTVEIFIEPNVPAPNLVVIGDSPVATTLAALGPVLGYRVVLVAPGAHEKDLPEVAALLEEFDRLAKELGPSSYVVVASMGKYDETALAAVLPHPTAFVGLVASRKRAASVFAALKEGGMTADAIGRVRNPVGIDVAAETPEEIALSILAEITQVRRTRASPAPTEPVSVGPPAPAIDPVCDMEVERTSPLHAEHAGTTYYFCSESCRRKFVRAPAKFRARAPTT
jgi:xanthine dehydrogenase accessory factor